MAYYMKETDISDCSRPEEVLEKVGKWTGDSTDMVTVTGLEVPYQKAMVRSDNQRVIGIVPDTLVQIQNHEALAYMHSILEKMKGSFQKFYEIDNGAMCMYAARIGDPLVIRELQGSEPDAIENGLFMHLPFDNTAPLHFKYGALRYKCTNQLTHFAKHNSLRIPRTASKESNMNKALDGLSLMKNFYTTFNETLRRMDRIIMDSKMVESYLLGVFRCTRENISATKAERLDFVRGLGEAGKGNNGQTLWDYYNGVTEWVDHHSEESETSRKVSSLLGSGPALKNFALEKAMELIRNQNSNN